MHDAFCRIDQYALVSAVHPGVFDLTIVIGRWPCGPVNDALLWIQSDWSGKAWMLAFGKRLIDDDCFIPSVCGVNGLGDGCVCQAEYLDFVWRRPKHVVAHPIVGDAMAMTVALQDDLTSSSIQLLGFDYELGGVPGIEDWKWDFLDSPQSGRWESPCAYMSFCPK